MTVADDLEDLELDGWEAMSADADEAHIFYDEVLDTDPVMVLPGGLVLDNRRDVLASLSGAPWSSFETEDLKVHVLTDDAAAVTYRVVAERGGRGEYVALVSSVYVRRAAGWRLALQQRTPDDED
jgi:hypothetical protein